MRDLQGNTIPSGKTTRKIEETFLGSTTLPSWMTVTGDNNFNFTIVPPQTDYGFLEVKTGNSVNNQATLNIFPNGINMQKIKEVKIEIDSLVFLGDHATSVFTMEISDTSKGVQIVAEGHTVKLKVKNPTQTLEWVIPQNWLYPGEWDQRKNIALSIKSDGTVALLESGTVVLKKKFTSEEMDITGILFPRLTVKKINTNAYGYSFKTSRVGFSLIHN